MVRCSRKINWTIILHTFLQYFNTHWEIWFQTFRKTLFCASIFSKIQLFQIMSTMIEHAIFISNMIFKLTALMKDCCHLLIIQEQLGTQIKIYCRLSQRAGSRAVLFLGDLSGNVLPKTLVCNHEGFFWFLSQIKDASCRHCSSPACPGPSGHMRHFPTSPPPASTLVAPFL